MAPKGKREKKIINLQNLKNIVNQTEEPSSKNEVQEEQIEVIPIVNDTKSDQSKKNEVELEEDEDLLAAFGVKEVFKTSSNQTIKPLEDSNYQEQSVGEVDEEFDGYKGKVTIKSKYRGPITRRNCTFDTRRI